MLRTFCIFFLILWSWYKSFSHDVTADVLVFQNNETAAMSVLQTTPFKFFVLINLQRWWPREWKRSIVWIAHFRYMKILTWFRSFPVICLYMVWSLWLKSLLGIVRQWSRGKFAILTLKPRSHVRIIYSYLHCHLLESWCKKWNLLYLELWDGSRCGPYLIFFTMS